MTCTTHVSARGNGDRRIVTGMVLPSVALPALNNIAIGANIQANAYDIAEWCEVLWKTGLPVCKIASHAKIKIVFHVLCWNGRLIIG